MDLSHASDMLTLQTKAVYGCQPQQKHNRFLLRAEFDMKQTQNHAALRSTLALLSLDGTMMREELNNSSNQNDMRLAVMTDGSVDPNIAPVSPLCVSTHHSSSYPSFYFHIHRQFLNGVKPNESVVK